MIERVCQHCLGEIPPGKRSHAVFCSTMCKSHAMNARAQSRYRSLRENRSCARCAEPIPLERTNKAIYCSEACMREEMHDRVRTDFASRPDRWCAHCGSAMAKTQRSTARHCSYLCKVKAQSSARRAGVKDGRRQDPVSRAYIIARDKSTCHLCGGRVPAHDVQLDHIVPLAVGGEHTAANLAVAHSLCNARKGARPANDQLRLVG